MEVLDRADHAATVGLGRYRADADRGERRRREGRLRCAARTAALAADLMTHRENRRARMHKFIEAPGKAIIVCGTREIRARVPGPGCLGSPPTCSDGTTVLKPRC